MCLMPTIRIPKVDRDERIGSVFNELFKVINATENSKENVIVWDFGGTSFFHPFFLAPLSIYRTNCGKDVQCVNIPEYLKSYFNLIHFEKMFDIEQKDFLVQQLNDYLGKTYLPICKFPLTDKLMVDNIQEILQRVIKRQSDYGSKIHVPLSFLLGELICNISEHSKSKYGYIYSQVSKRDGCINLCIADSGITIYGSYVGNKDYAEEINSEADAMKLAMTGHSTKDSNERGFGLSSSKRLLVNGLKGSFFVLSGGAFYRYENDKENYVELPDGLGWNGTIILMKVPTSAGDNFNFYNYLE